MIRPTNSLRNLTKWIVWYFRFMADVLLFLRINLSPKGARSLILVRDPYQRRYLVKRTTNRFARLVNSTPWELEGLSAHDLFRVDPALFYHTLKEGQNIVVHPWTVDEDTTYRLTISVVTTGAEHQAVCTLYQDLTNRRVYEGLHTYYSHKLEHIHGALHGRLQTLLSQIRSRSIDALEDTVCNNCVLHSASQQRYSLGSIRSNAEDATRLLRDIIAEIRDNRQLVRATNLGDAVESLCKQYDQRDPNQQFIYIIDPKAYMYENEDVIHKLCACIEEALLNAYKHSESRDMLLILTEAEGIVPFSVEIRDYGIGFDPEQVQLQGLHFVREAMRDLSGFLIIDSSLESGTSITLRFTSPTLPVC